MSRGRTRILETGDAFYHVMSRTYDKRYLLNGCERAILYRFIRNAAHFCGVEVLAFALMSNHFHLLVRVPRKREVSDAELVQRMRGLYGNKHTDEILAQWAKWERIDGSPRRRLAAQKALRARMYSLPQFCKTFKEIFAMNYNDRNAHTTSVWGGQRYKSVLVSPDPRALLSVASYIDHNPVRAKMFQSAASSQVSTLGMALSGDAFAQNALRNLIMALQGEAVKWSTAAARYAGMLGCELPGTFASLGQSAKTDGLKARKQMSRVRQYTYGLILGSVGFVAKYVGKSLKNRFRRMFVIPALDGDGLVSPVRLRGPGSGYKNGESAKTPESSKPVAVGDR